MDDKKKKLNLKREVGLLGAVSLIAGTMIGAGIFMTPQTVLYSIGSPGASLVVWAACGLLVIMVSFCYVELGTVIRESGGEYIYILRTSSPVLAFMLIFSAVTFVRPADVAGLAIGFVQCRGHIFAADLFYVHFRLFWCGDVMWDGPLN